MNKFSTALMTTALSATALTTACNAPDHAGELAALTKRVEALEKRAPQPAARPQRPNRPDPKQTYYLPVRADDPYRGASHAKVTLVEVYEYACPYCAMIEPMLAEVLEGYDGTDTLKVVSKQFVVHPQLATDAALATCAAHKQSKFEAFAGALWKTSWNVESGRPRLQREELTREELVELAKSVGLDTDRFTADLEGEACKAKLNRDRTELARVGVRGTPYLFINGRYYTGPRSADGLRKAIDAAAAVTDRALKEGIALSEYYGGLMKTAKRSL